MKKCNYRGYDKDLSYRHGSVKYCNKVCYDKEYSWRNAEKIMSEQKSNKCIWCKKGKYSCHFLNHQKYYDNFRAGFNSEILAIKNKPRESDTEKFKKIRRYLTNT